jgi:hypothetical protein
MDSGHNCNDTKQYSELYDAYYCPECNIWLESKCDDPECDYCPKRPDQPNQNQLTNN